MQIVITREEEIHFNSIWFRYNVQIFRLNQLSGAYEYAGEGRYCSSKGEILHYLQSIEIGV